MESSWESAQFGIEETVKSNVVRLALTGELDLAVAEKLRARLETLADAGATVTLDLSRLDFVDSSGLNVLITYKRYAARDGWNLEVNPRISGEVARIIKMAGLDALLWP
jgi:anti-anti-sigma factor